MPRSEHCLASCLILRLPDTEPFFPGQVSIRWTIEDPPAPNERGVLWDFAIQIDGKRVPHLKIQSHPHPFPRLR